MASHHHLCHHPAAASYCSCYSPHSSCHHHPPPPPLPDCHPIYHQPFQPHLYSAQTPIPDSIQYRPSFRGRYHDEERETQYTIASLLRRIAALESALRGRTSSSSSYALRDAAARTIQTHFRAFLLRRSRTLRQLKDLASIKSALGILKSSVTKIHSDYDLIYNQAMELALKLDTVQGGDPMIRDGKTLVKRELDKFMDFIDVYYIERVSSSRGVNMRYARSDSSIRVPNGGRKIGNANSGVVKSFTMDKLRGLAKRIDKITEEPDEEEQGNREIESHGVFVKKHCVSGSKNVALSNQLSGARPVVKKRVSFAHGGKLYRVLSRNSVPISDTAAAADAADDDDRVNPVSGDFEDDDVCQEVQENGVSLKEADHDDEDEDEGEDEAESRSENDDDGDTDSRIYLRNEGVLQRKMYNQGEDDNGIPFSTPLPLKMETRASLIDKKKKPALAS